VRGTYVRPNSTVLPLEDPATFATTWRSKQMTDHVARSVVGQTVDITCLHAKDIVRSTDAEVRQFYERGFRASEWR